MAADRYSASALSMVALSVGWMARRKIGEFGVFEESPLDRGEGESEEVAVTLGQAAFAGRGGSVQLLGVHGVAGAVQGSSEVVPGGTQLAGTVIS